MSRTSRSKDFDVRSAVVRRLLDTGVPRRDIRHELTLNTSSSGGRLDIAVLRDTCLTTIEVKSGADTLDRLKAQAAAYERAFDYVWLVADSRHREALQRNHFGVRVEYYDHTARDFMGYYMGKPSPVRAICVNDRWSRSGVTSVLDVMNLLWASEAAWVAGKLLYPCKTRTAAIDWLRENASLKEVRPLVIEALRDRSQSRWEEAFWSKFDALPAPETREAA